MRVTVMCCFYSLNPAGLHHLQEFSQITCRPPDYLCWLENGSWDLQYIRWKVFAMGIQIGPNITVKFQNPLANYHGGDGLWNNYSRSKWVRIDIKILRNLGRRLWINNNIIRHVSFSVFLYPCWMFFYYHLTELP